MYAEEFIDVLESLMVGKLHEKMMALGLGEFNRLSRLLFLQTSDELWVDHLSLLQDRMLTTRLFGYSHKTSVSEYLLQSKEDYSVFREELVDQFLSRLVDISPETFRVPRCQEIEVDRNIQEILV